MPRYDLGTLSCAKESLCPTCSVHELTPGFQRHVAVSDACL